MVLRGSRFISEGAGYALYAVCGITLVAAVAALLLPRGSRRRRRLSEYLRNVLVLAGIVTVVAIIDTLGQSAYLFYTLPDHGISRWLGDAVAVIGGLLAAGAAAARRITVAMRGTSAISRSSCPHARGSTTPSVSLTAMTWIGKTFHYPCCGTKRSSRPQSIRIP